MKIKIIIILMLFIIGVGFVIGLSGGDEILFIEKIKASFIQEESQLAITDLSTPISDTQYNNNSYKKIETEFIDFEVPVIAKHMWINGGLDKYEVIIRNLSIKGFQDYVLRVTWEDERYIKESFEIHYTFKDGVLNESDIDLKPINKTPQLTFKNKKFELGTLIGQKYTIRNKENCIFTKDDECLVNVSSPVYSWEDYTNIDTGDKINFTAIDDTAVSACGFLGGAGVYNLEADLLDEAATCITINSSNVLFNGNNFSIDGVTTGNAIITDLDLTNITVRDINLSDFSTTLQVSSIQSEFFNINITRNTVSSFKTGLQVSNRFNNFTNIHVKDFTGGSSISIIFVFGNNRFFNGSVINGVKAIRFGSFPDNVILSGYTITDHDIGIEFLGSGSDNHSIRNNIFNNTENIQTNIGANIYYNITESATTSIIGGANSGGNFWAFPNGTGYSETCTVSGSSGICENPVNASTSLECVGCTGVNIDSLPLTFETAGDTCTYSSGDFVVTCSDDCEITSPITIDGDLLLTGIGTFTVRDNITFSGAGRSIFVPAQCDVDVVAGGGFV